MLARHGAVGRRGKGGSKSVGELVQIVGIRSLLVDVHLLGLAGQARDR